MRILSRIRYLAPAVVCALAAISALAADKEKTRVPAVAGQFYPADPKELGTMLDGFLAKAAPPALKDSIVALVSPHAGYQYSGGVAAYGYALLKGVKVDRVIVIAPSHIEAFSFSSVFDGDAYQTPLGRIPVDKAFASKLVAASPLIKLSSRGHAITGSRSEHALEVQLPFLQRVLGQFQLVPIVMGSQDYDHCRALGIALAKLISLPGTVIVASSDLSHFHPYDVASKMDRKTLKAVEDWDYLSMTRNFQGNVWEACGGGPIVAAMIAAERLGANQARLLKYANSGDVTGDKSQVVGYGSMALVKAAGPRGSTGPQFTLTPGEKRELIEIAKKSVEVAVKEHKLWEVPAPKSEALERERGAFVTLKKKGDLRGCIGYSAPLKPLYVTVRDVAAYAAVEDTRFQPVVPAELPALDFEVSVLSPLRRVTNLNEIQVGVHGLVLKKGEREGLLLPQVAPEQGWSRTEFLENICLKSSLPNKSWLDEQADLFSFTALVFGEERPAGSKKTN